MWHALRLGCLLAALENSAHLANGCDWVLPWQVPEPVVGTTVSVNLSHKAEEAGGCQQ